MCIVRYGLALAVTTRLCCVSAMPEPAGYAPLSNWSTPAEPCAHFDDLRKPVIGDVGVKIDATGPWADGFRRALRFWNGVLAANFHEETSLNGCAVRIIDAGSGILNGAVTA